jgi:hypothetical protein
MSSWTSYPKIYNMGHKAIQNLFLDTVVVEEKIDGSQFSFGVFAGELRCRSKGAPVHIDAPEKMFVKAVETAKKLAPILHDGWTYRGEYLQSPKHNTLAYDRYPTDHIIIFDIAVGEEDYLDYAAKKAEADRIGLETVPLLYEGLVSDVDTLTDLLKRTSTLGGQMIEGFVVKNHSRFDSNKQSLLGKHVSEYFKEIHSGDWRDRNPISKDIVQLLGDKYRTPARWNKALQHLTEAGACDGSPRDIGPLIRECIADVETECQAEIAQALWGWAWPRLQREVVKGLPQWYKEHLMQGQMFSGELLAD